MSSQVLPLVSLVSTLAIRATGQVPTVQTPNAGIWRPPQWSNGTVIAATLIVPPSSQASLSFGDPGLAQGINGNIIPPSPLVYVFSAIWRTNHRWSVTKTQNPIQSGANVSDHIYYNPQAITLEIGMSDAMDAYSAGLWSGAGTQSVNAFNTLVTIMNNRAPVTLNTRQYNYQNLVIVDIDSDDTLETFAGLHAVIRFEQLMLATVTATSSSLITTSALPQTTNSSSGGAIQTQSPTAALQNQFDISNTATAIPSLPAVPGSGTWSSNNLGSLESTFG